MRIMLHFHQAFFVTMIFHCGLGFNPFPLSSSRRLSVRTFSSSFLESPENGWTVLEDWCLKDAVKIYKFGDTVLWRTLKAKTAELQDRSIEDIQARYSEISGGKIKGMLSLTAYNESLPNFNYLVNCFSGYETCSALR